MIPEFQAHNLKKVSNASATIYSELKSTGYRRRAPIKTIIIIRGVNMTKRLIWAEETLLCPVRKSLEFKNLIVVKLTIYWVSFWSERKML